MKALIITDLEGIIGVDDIYSEASMEKLVEEENLILEELKNFGIDEVTIYYIHNGGNIDKKYVDRIRTETFVCGFKPLSDKSYLFAIMNGFHARKGVKSRFSHTLRDDIKGVFYNGKQIGEIELYGYWLLGKQLPILYVAGEVEAISETHDLETCFFPTNNCLEYEDKLKMYALFIRRCIKSHFPKHISSSFNNEIQIELSNEDTAQSMKELGYRVIGNNIVFNEIDSFIENEIEFCKHLHTIQLEILKRNVDWALMNSDKIREMFLRCSGNNEIFSKGLDEITMRDIKKIEMMLNQI